MLNKIKKRFGGFGLYRIKSKFIKETRDHKFDDFNWRFYTDHYKEELRFVEKKHSLSIRPGDYAFIDNKLTLKNKKILPLHTNYKIIYETAMQLAPDSILEVGCGRGDHLNNLNTLLPNTELFGVDISKRQLKLLRKIYPLLNAKTIKFDLTEPLPKKFTIPKVDLVYTQAVIMHIQTSYNHLKALENIFKLSNKYVLLMENWTRHHFMNDIRYLYDERKIKWKEIFFYYRESEESKKPHLMIISSIPLDQYHELEDYSLLSGHTDNTIDYS